MLKKIDQNGFFLDIVNGGECIIKTLNKLFLRLELRPCRTISKFLSNVEGLMGRMWGISNKRFLLIAFLAFLTMFGTLISHSYGEEVSKTKYGVSIFGGMGDAWHNETNFTVYGVLPRIDLPLHRNWDLEFEGNYSYWNIRAEHDLYFLGVDFNLLFKPIQGKWGSLFLLAGGGLVTTAPASE